MKQVLRESLFLLLGGNIASVLGHNRLSESMTLTYADFVALRPEFARSSWRGAMLKATSRKWVQKNEWGGETAFQLTLLGTEEIRQEIGFIKPESSSDHWLLALLQPHPERAERQYKAAQRELETRGFANLLPSVYALPKDTFDQGLVEQLRRYGFYVTLVPVQPQKAKPMSLAAFLEESPASRQKARELVSLSKNVTQLLHNLHQRKSIHPKQKEQIGSYVVSGLTLFKQLSWVELIQDQAQSLVFSLSEQLDELMRLYLAQK